MLSLSVSKRLSRLGGGGEQRYVGFPRRPPGSHNYYESLNYRMQHTQQRFELSACDFQVGNDTRIDRVALPVAQRSEGDHCAMAVANAQACPAETGHPAQHVPADDAFLANPLDVLCRAFGEHLPTPDK